MKVNVNRREISFELKHICIKGRYLFTISSLHVIKHMHINDIDLFTISSLWSNMPTVPVVQDYKIITYSHMPLKYVYQ